MREGEELHLRREQLVECGEIEAALEARKTKRKLPAS